MNHKKYTWNNTTVWKLFVLVGILDIKTVWKLLVLDRNTSYLVTISICWGADKRVDPANEF